VSGVFPIRATASGGLPDMDPVGRSVLLDDLV